MEDVQVKRLVKRGRGKTVDYDVYKRPIMARISFPKRENYITRFIFPKW